MGQTVYVDLFFLINFSMDFLCFFLTAKLLGHRLSLPRALLGAALGGLYADGALFFSLEWPWSLLIDLSVCAVMCASVFGGRKRWRSLPLYILVFVAISMALGGFMTALFHLLNRTGLFTGAEQSDGDGISVWVFAFLALLSGLITWAGGRLFAGRASRKSAEVEMRYNGKSVRLRALSDSGNLLREPISGKPCIVADRGALSSFLPVELILASENEGSPDPSHLSPEHAKNIRLIPVKTASGEGILLGVRMERVTVLCGKERKDVDAPVVLAELGDSAEGHEALLPARLLI